MNLWILLFPLVFWIYEVNCKNCGDVECKETEFCVINKVSTTFTGTCEKDAKQCFGVIDTVLDLGGGKEVCCLPDTGSVTDAIDDYPTGKCTTKPACHEGDTSDGKPYCKYKGDGTGGDLDITHADNCEGGGFFNDKTHTCCIPFNLVESDLAKTGGAFPDKCSAVSGCDVETTLCMGKCEYKLTGNAVSSVKCKDECAPNSCCVNGSSELSSYKRANGLPVGCEEKVCSATLPCFGNNCGFSLDEKSGEWKAECKDCDEKHKCCIQPGNHFLGYTDISAKPANCTPVCEKDGDFNSFKLCKYVFKGKDIDILKVDTCTDKECCLPPSIELETYERKSKQLPKACTDSICQKGGDPCFRKCQFSLKKNKVKASCEKTCKEQCCLKPGIELDSTWGSKLPDACLEVCEEGGKNIPSTKRCKYVKNGDAIEVTSVDTCLNTECCLKAEKKLNNFKKSNKKLPEECQDKVCSKDIPCYGACEFNYENVTKTMHINCIDSKDCGTKCCLEPGPTLKKDFKKGKKLPNDCNKVCKKGGPNCLKKFCLYVKDETTVTVECVDDCPEKSICLAPSEKNAKFDPNEGELPATPSPSENNNKTTSTAFKRVKSNLLIIISVILALRQ